MGLIKAAIGSIGSTFADQWRDYFYCDSLDSNTLISRGYKKVGKRSSNVKGNDNVISQGSLIAVADGQCLLVVEQGKVVDLCSEPGEYRYDRDSEPSIFVGNFGDSLKKTFETIGKRFTFGGDAGMDQRIYFVNTKEIVNNKFGTPTPIPFRIVDRNINLDIDVSVRCNGIYSYRITNPILFYTNVCGNVSEEFSRINLDSQLKTEFIGALQPAFAQISAMQVRPNDLPAHSQDLANAMNEILTEKWNALRGISIVSVSMNTIHLPEEDASLIRKAQHAAILRDPTMAAATLVEAQASAMKSAAENSAGAAVGFMGMGLAKDAAATNAANLFAMGSAQEKTASSAVQTNGREWICSCGSSNQKKFCPNCGKERPEAKWTCSCGAENSGKFCPECGKPRPVGEFRCNQCGWKPEKGAAVPKFCPECGDRFDENDRV